MFHGPNNFTNYRVSESFPMAQPMGTIESCFECNTCKIIHFLSHFLYCMYLGYTK